VAVRRAALAFSVLSLSASVAVGQGPPVPLALLEPSDGSGRDDFGWALAVDGDTAMVGAPRRGETAGGVYVFARDGGGWRETGRLLAQDLPAGAWFGSSIALAGDWAVIGASELGAQAPAGEVAVVRAGTAPWSHTAPRLATGSVLVFRRTEGGWTRAAHLVGGRAGFGARFGAAVALADDRLVVGAPGDEEGRGAVYAYRRDAEGWHEEGRLQAAEGPAKPEYGLAVALRGSTLAVGSRSAHRVEVFRSQSSGWQREAIVEDPAAAFGTGFGVALWLGEDELLVGAPLTNDVVVVPPAAYLFRRGPAGWSASARFAGADEQVDFGFARSVVRSRDTAIVLGSREAYRFPWAGDSAGALTPLGLSSPAGPQVYLRALAADGRHVLLAGQVWGGADGPSEVVGVFDAAAAHPEAPP
jgi:hypothetical protein